LSSLPAISGFSDVSIIGHGATATVYRAMQDGFDRPVAIKVLHLDISDRRAQKRFQRERSLNGRLSNHPNVVTVLDSGFVEGRHPYLVMEYLEEGSLADRLKARGPFELALTMHIGVRIAGALESAHRVGVLHRDVKPNNILLSRFEEPALADFGIAAILEMEQSFTAALTPVHAAPELLEGSEPSPQTDVYALGSTLYTLLAGVAPFAGPAGEGMLSQLLRITTSDVPTLARQDTPREVLDLLRDSMAKRPENRIASAGEFGERLQALQSKFGPSVSVLPVDVPSKVAASSMSLLDSVTAVETNPIAAAETAEADTPAELAPAGRQEALTVPNNTDSHPEDTDPTITFEPAEQGNSEQVFSTQILSAQIDSAQIDSAQIDRAELPVEQIPAQQIPVEQISVEHVAVVPTSSPTPNMSEASRQLLSAASIDPDLTISARQIHPVLPPEVERKRRWWTIPLIMAGSVGIAATGTVLVMANSSDDAGRGAKPTIVKKSSTTAVFEAPVSTSGQPTTSIDYSSFVPTNVVVAAQDGALSVRFTDHTEGQRQHLIKIARNPDKKALDPIITRKGQSYLVLPPELDAAEPICVVVSAVVALPDRFAQAPPFCLNGGKIG
jgi:serine/threonine protein kinase